LIWSDLYPLLANRHHVKENSSLFLLIPSLEKQTVWDWSLYCCSLVLLWFKLRVLRKIPSCYIIYCTVTMWEQNLYLQATCQLEDTISNLPVFTCFTKTNQAPGWVSEVSTITKSVFQSSVKTVARKTFLSLVRSSGLICFMRQNYPAAKSPEQDKLLEA